MIQLISLYLSHSLTLSLSIINSDRHILNDWTSCAHITMGIHFDLGWSNRCMGFPWTSYETS
jgi:hypothetical protein